jgi:hypothetical protein
MALTLPQESGIGLSSLQPGFAEAVSKEEKQGNTELRT